MREILRLGGKIVFLFGMIVLSDKMDLYHWVTHLDTQSDSVFLPRLFVCTKVRQRQALSEIHGAKL
jgi:hypothetical protein